MNNKSSPKKEKIHYILIYSLSATVIFCLYYYINYRKLGLHNIKFEGQEIKLGRFFLESRSKGK